MEQLECMSGYLCIAVLSLTTQDIVQNCIGCQHSTDSLFAYAWMQLEVCLLGNLLKLTRKFVYRREHFRRVAALYVPSGKLICNRNHLKNTEDLVLVIGQE